MEMLYQNILFGRHGIIEMVIHGEGERDRERKSMSYILRAKTEACSHES